MDGFGTGTEVEAGVYVNAWGEGRKVRVGHHQSVVSLERPTSLEIGCRSRETCALKITSVDEAVVEDAVVNFVLGIHLE